MIDGDIRRGEFDVRLTLTSTVRPLHARSQPLSRSLPTRREEPDQYEVGRFLYTAIEAPRMDVVQLPGMACKLLHWVWVHKATASALLAVQTM